MAFVTPSLSRSTRFGIQIGLGQRRRAIDGFVAEAYVSPPIVAPDSAASVLGFRGFGL
jgi:hypothetical protein